MNPLLHPNQQWTLFLDRDGVINRDKPGDYIYSIEEFEFYAGVLESLAILNRLYGRIVMVTNQRGIGRGLMSEETLVRIHEYMMATIREAGGRIDKIYYCTADNNSDPNRKPNPGMALQAKSEFPDIDFSRSIIVGNNTSDMEFGRNAGIHTVFVRTTLPDLPLPDPRIDLAYDSLADFTKALAGR